MTKKKRVGRRSLLPDIHSDCASGLFVERPAHIAASVLAVCGLCVLAISLFARSLEAKQKPTPTKTVTGDVLDQSDHNVSGASVFLTDLETRHTDAIYSGADGKYNFSGLNPNDDYQVQAKYKGLVSDIRKASSFDTRNPLVINLVLTAPGSQNASESR